MGKYKNITVTQEQDNEIAPEILATSIVEISKGVKKILNSKLKIEAILTLLKDKTGIPKAQIKRVIDSLESLEKDWCK